MHDFPQHSRCPNCGGNMEFNITLAKLHCLSCNTMMTVDDYEEILKQKSDVSDRAEQNFVKGADENEGRNSDTPQTENYICSSCGGSISLSALSASSHCPFCNNAIVFVDKYRNQRNPDFIIPFRYDRRHFENTFQKLLDSRLFLPDAFREEVNINKIRAVYVPFWLYSVKAEGDAEFLAEKQIKIIKRGLFNEPQKPHYRHIVTSEKNSGTMICRYIPQDASTDIDDDISQGLEPFNTDDITNFSFGYLSGLNALIYDMDAKASFSDVQKRVEKSFRNFIVKADNYSYLKIDSVNATYTPQFINYALFPIWMAQADFNGKTYRYAMNGQTGKALEDLPSSKFKKYSFLYGSWFLFSVLSIRILDWISAETDIHEKPEKFDSFPVLFFLISVPVISYVIMTRCFLKLMYTNNQRTALSNIVAGAFILFLMFDCTYFFRFEMMNYEEYMDMAAIFIMQGIAVLLARDMILNNNTQNHLHFKNNADSYISWEKCRIENIYSKVIEDRVSSDQGTSIKNATRGIGRTKDDKEIRNLN